MERSKWKACVTGQHVRGFCRTHEAQHKLAMPVKNRSLLQLLKANRGAYIAKNHAAMMLLMNPVVAADEVVEMEVSVDGSHFKNRVQDLLFE